MSTCRGSRRLETGQQPAGRARLPVSASTEAGTRRPKHTALVGGLFCSAPRGPGGLCATPGSQGPVPFWPPAGRGSGNTPWLPTPLSVLPGPALSQSHHTPPGQGQSVPTPSPVLRLPWGRPQSPRPPRPSLTKSGGPWGEHSGTPRSPHQQAAQGLGHPWERADPGSQPRRHACCSWKPDGCSDGQGVVDKGRDHCWLRAQQTEGNCGEREGTGDSLPRGQEPLQAGDKRATTTGSGHVSQVPPGIPQPPLPHHEPPAAGGGADPAQQHPGPALGAPRPQLQ